MSSRLSKVLYMKESKIKFQKTRKYIEKDDTIYIPMTFLWCNAIIIQVL